MTSKRVFSAVLCAAAVFGFALNSSHSASGAMFQFNLAAQPSSPNYLTAGNAGGQLWLYVDDDPTDGDPLNTGSSDRVNLTFYYQGPIAGEITDIYFDDAGLAGEEDPTYSGSAVLALNPPPAVGIIQSAGVNFSAVNMATPSWGGDMSVLTQLQFRPDIGFSAESNESVGSGVGNAWLEFVTLNMNGTASAFVTALTTPIDPGPVGGNTTYQLRIGVQVQDIDGNSQTDRYFVNQGAGSLNSPPVMPEPASVTLWALGLALCGGGSYWKSRRQKQAA
jgi:hypothetical protein